MSSSLAGYQEPGRLTTVGVAFVPTPEGESALREAVSLAQMSDAGLRVLTADRDGDAGAPCRSDHGRV